MDSRKKIQSSVCRSLLDIENEEGLTAASSGYVAVRGRHCDRVYGIGKSDYGSNHTALGICRIHSDLIAVRAGGYHESIVTSPSWRSKP